MTLRGRTPLGRICSNCCTIRNSAACAHCGDYRRVDGRDAEGRPWCQRCRNRQRRQAADGARRELIVDTVRRVDPAVTAETVGVVLAETVPSRR